MTTLSVAREVIELCRISKVSLFLWGTHGIGKSSLVRQTATDLGIDFIDFRCAQIEACDLRGLPDKTTEGKTRFLPPEELPTTGNGILFLDELNRANPEVLSAVFQLILDRKIGQYQLPNGWSIVCAGNCENAGYSVSALDPALQDRFCHIVISSGVLTYNEWSTWMSSNYPSHAMDIVGFCGINLNHLEVVESEELAFKISPSRRSWEMVGRCLLAWDAGKYSEKSRVEILSGILGRDLAISFLRHRMPVTPIQILTDGVWEHEGLIRTLDSGPKSSLMWGLLSYARKAANDSTIAKTLVDFAEFLFEDDNDLAVAYTAGLFDVDDPDRGLNALQRNALIRNPELLRAINEKSHELRKPTSMILKELAERPDLANLVNQAFADEIT